MDKKAAAEKLNISTRLVERYASEGRLGEVKYVRGKTGKQADYDEAAVERLRQELESADHPLAAPHSPATGLAVPSGDGLQRITQSEEARAFLVEAIREAISTSNTNQKFLFSLADVAKRTGLSVHYLRGEIRRKNLRGKIIAGAYRVTSEELRRYREQLEATINGNGKAE
jgi:hypothetical protein